MNSIWISLSRITGVLLITLGFVGVSKAATTPAEDFVYFHEHVLGTSLELRVNAESASAAKAAESRTLAEIDRLARVLSSYDAGSEFRRWQASTGAPTKLSPELLELLAASDHWNRESGGAFDPRVQALSDLWSRCAKLDRLPTDRELADAKALMASPAWRLDPAAGMAEHLTACPLTLNSIGKGFIIGKACEKALDRTQGVHGVLLNIGGDIRAAGDVHRTIGIAPARGDSETADPILRVRVKDLSVATSGNAQRGYRVGGQWYSHIFDPSAARPAERVIASTVICPRAADANALATTLNVLPVAEGLRLIAAQAQTDCLIVTADGEQHRSPGWAMHELPGDPLPVAALLADAPATKPAKEAAKGPAWAEKFEFVVNYEIGGPENDGRYRRPYVAVWIEDKDGLAVRTLSLFISPRGQRWYPDLKRWYRGDQMRKLVDDTNVIDTVSRPTRPPGKYSAAWDGKDDRGKPLSPGVYTVCIEAAREHGTYQVIRNEITVGDKPATVELKGNVEIKSASIEYRAKSGK